MNEATHFALGACLFAIGAVVGSFINVCVYRLPWQKSVIWPASHCPRCLKPIAARDNITVLGWLLLRGECRRCGARISPRYALVEALVGTMFVGVYVVDVALNPMGLFGNTAFFRMAYHQVLLALLTTATFIDYDFQIIPDEVTVPGMLFGLIMGALLPTIRPEPNLATTFGGGLWQGVLGLLVGGGLPLFFRTAFRLLGRDAMGFGDVTLMAMVGAFLGWQAALLTFFIAPFFGLAHAMERLVVWIGKLLRRQPTSSEDRALPFGPYLSMGAATCVFAWPWLWSGWGAEFFRTLSVVFLWMIGADAGP